jgi:hypothetical protein
VQRLKSLSHRREKYAVQDKANIGRLLRLDRMILKPFPRPFLHAGKIG